MNVVRAPGRPLSNYRPDIPFENLRRYGFQTMLIDLIEAPEPMLCYFCHYNGLHQIPIAESLAPEQIERIKRDLPKLRLFFTSSTRVRQIFCVDCLPVATCVSAYARFLNLNSVTGYYMFVVFRSPYTLIPTLFHNLQNVLYVQYLYMIVCISNGYDL